MLKRYAESFYQAGAIIAALKAYWDFDSQKRREELQAGDPVLWQKGAQVIGKTSLRLLAERLQELDLRFSLKSVARLNEVVETATSDELQSGFDELDRRVRDEITERVLFFVAPDRAVHYDEFRRGWERALAKFPIAVDAEEAEKCFALERWTGCVFHLMRIVEIGVQALGTHLKITVAATEAWGTVVREIQDAVKAMPHSAPAEKEEQSHFGNLADALFQINLAWRIPTMHPRTPGASYNEEQAFEALGRVKSFMRALEDVLP